jgi:DNA-directed RNA polymerase alpha subunit
MIPFKTAPLLDQSIEELELPTRVENSLLRWGIQTVGKLIRTSKKELFEIPGFGTHSFRYVCESLAALWFSQWDQFWDEWRGEYKNAKR